MGQWIAECCDTVHNPVGLLRFPIRVMAPVGRSAGEFVSSQKRFCQKIEARGFKPQRTVTRRDKGFRGIVAVRNPPGKKARRSLQTTMPRK